MAGGCISAPSSEFTILPNFLWCMTDSNVWFEGIKYMFQAYNWLHEGLLLVKVHFPSNTLKHWTIGRNAYQKRKIIVEMSFFAGVVAGWFYAKKIKKC